MIGLVKILSGIHLEIKMADIDIRRLVFSNIPTAYNNAIFRCTAVLNTDAAVSCIPEGHVGVQGECKDRDVA